MTDYKQCTPYIRLNNPDFESNLLDQHRHPEMAAIPEHDPFSKVLIHMALWPTMVSMLERIKKYINLYF